MAAIKIISNPYKKETLCQQWDEDKQVWQEINREHNPNSNLVREKINGIVFPFKAKEMLDVIYSDYRSNTAIDLYFQGTDDEYAELEKLCDYEEYREKIALHRSEKTLKNARDILPEINAVFQQNIFPVIAKSGLDSDCLEKEVEKYNEASGDVIPICILGNYSSGKSTFINALIGSEILPSGADPLTSKVFEIHRSPQQDHASIQFTYQGEEVTINFSENDYEIGTINYDTPFFHTLFSNLDSAKNTSLPQMVSTALLSMNGAQNAIDDLIKLEVPFTGGLWDETDKQFVLFDTPGSNPSSNKDHIAVLEKALENFSNGLVIYVSERDDLDSDDNQELIDQIKTLNKMDRRFSMIVINKSDAAKLPSPGEEAVILQQTLPKEEHSGIYFVSSVMGLGAKIDGEFVDDYLAELYESNERKFNDPKSRFYKTLYKHNILPEQIKKRTVDEALAEQNLLYANSGLFTVEKEIHTFAENYAAYDKCTKAAEILDAIVKTAEAHIITEKDSEEMHKGLLRTQSAEKEESLKEAIVKKSSELKEQFLEAYPSWLHQFDEALSESFTTEQLQEKQDNLEHTLNEEKEVQNRDNDVKESFDKIGEDFAGNIKKVFGKGKILSIFDIGKDFVMDIGNMADKIGTLNDTKKEIEKDTAEILIEYVKKLFKVHLFQIQSRLLFKSKEYWQEKTDAMKTELLDLINFSGDLSEAESADLKNIIMSYEPARFDDDADEVFTADKHRQGWGFNNLFGTDKLDLEHVRDAYNAEIKKEIAETHDEIHPKHKDSFVKWTEALILTLQNNLRNYSEDLLIYQRQIQAAEASIQEKEAILAELKDYHQQIKSMMDWQNM